LTDKGGIFGGMKCTTAQTMIATSAAGLTYVLSPAALVSILSKERTGFK
jgi:hypothetical protein